MREERDLVINIPNQRAEFPRPILYVWCERGADRGKQCIKEDTASPRPGFNTVYNNSLLLNLLFTARQHG